MNLAAGVRDLHRDRVAPAPGGRRHGSVQVAAGLAGRGGRPPRRATRSSRSTARQFDQFGRRTDASSSCGANAGQTVTLGVSPRRRDERDRDRHAARRRSRDRRDARGARDHEPARPSTRSDFTRADRGRASAIGADRTTRSRLILGGLGQIGNSIVDEPDRGAAGVRPHRDRVQIGDVFWRPGRSSRSTSRDPVGQPRPREHPAVPAARRRPDADDRAQARSSATGSAPGGAADVPRRLRVPVRLPDLDHRLRHRPARLAAVHVTPHGQPPDASASRPTSRRVRRSPWTSVACSSAARHPIVVQSMTNTDTADPDATALQVARLAHAGSQLVRVTVNTEQAAARRARDDPQAPGPGRRRAGHRRLPLQRPPAAGRVSGEPRRLAKYRINPGNVGAKRHDENFATIVRVAIDNDKPVRIGVNWGSLDQQLLTELMDANAALPRAARRARRDDRRDDRVGDALRRAGRADRPRARPDHPVGQGVAACATWSTSTGSSRPARTTRSISG